MEESKHVSTSMVTSCNISKEDESKEVNETLYISMIRKLQYGVYRRPNIAQVVGIVARF